MSLFYVVGVLVRFRKVCLLLISRGGFFGVYSLDKCQVVEGGASLGFWVLEILSGVLLGVKKQLCLFFFLVVTLGQRLVWLGLYEGLGGWGLGRKRFVLFMGFDFQFLRRVLLLKRFRFMGSVGGDFESLMLNIKVGFSF